MKVRNGNKVYVQRCDISYINEMIEDIPESIRNKNSTGALDEYFVFENNEDIAFLDSIDWLIDYKEYNKLEYEELIKLSNDLYSVINDESLGIEDKKNLIYKYKYIIDLVRYREGVHDLKLPLVVDNDSFLLQTSSCNPKFYIASSIDPNKLLLYKENNEKLSYFDNIPTPLIDSAINLNNPNRKDPPITMGNTIRSCYFSDDFKYYIVETKFKLYEKVNSPNNNNRKGFVKTLLKKINKS